MGAVSGPGDFSWTSCWALAADMGVQVLKSATTLNPCRGRVLQDEALAGLTGCAGGLVPVKEEPASPPQVVRMTRYATRDTTAQRARTSRRVAVKGAGVAD